MTNEQFVIVCVVAAMLVFVPGMWLASAALKRFGTRAVPYLGAVMVACLAAIAALLLIINRT